MMRRVMTACAVLLALAVPVADTLAYATPCWTPALRGQVIDPYREPSCRYCAGNRGIEYRVGLDVRVRAVEAGRVTFSGSVAGTQYVVLEHANGWKVTYGQLTHADVRRGDRVGRGAVLGRASRTFFFGLRVDDRYRDPEPYLGRFVGRPRLVPIDGTMRRPPPSPRLSCAA